MNESKNDKTWTLGSLLFFGLPLCALVFLVVGTAKECTGRSSQPTLVPEACHKKAMRDIELNLDRIQRASEEIDEAYGEASLAASFLERPVDRRDADGHLSELNAALSKIRASNSTLRAELEALRRLRETQRMQGIE